MADVLVVDDDEIIRGMLAFLFESEGYSVEQAKDGAVALESLHVESPECMVLDLMMPGVDGLTVLRQRAAEGLAADTRVVVLTAKSGSDDAVWCWEAGADEYLTKPFDPQKLVRIVKDLTALSPEEAKRRRDVGLAEARRLDAIEAALRER
jgi:DNA-binding response OmpR family regulator